MPDHEPLQPLDYATPAPRSRRRPIAFVLILLAITGAGVFLLWTARPTLITTRATSNRARCQSNMHQIGLGILLYQSDHAGWYPNSLDELLEENITASVFVCPDTNDGPSDGATTQAIAADFHATGHLSYIYIGKGLDDKTATHDTVVLYEPLTNHGGDGMNILFGDGHVEWFNATVGKQVIAATATGKRVKIHGGVVSVASSAIQPGSAHAP